MQRLIERHRGICRTVYLVGPWAIKTPRLRLPRTSDGKRMTGQHETSWAISRAVQANLSERQWSGTEGTNPVLLTLLGGLVNIYPRLRPWPLSVDPPYDDIGEGWIARDRKPENIGIDHETGEPLWLDYDASWNGCPHERNVGRLMHVNDVLVEEACEVMHDAYETAAVGAEWETQAASRKPWADVPEANQATMRAAVRALLEHLDQ